MSETGGELLRLVQDHRSPYSVEERVKVAALYSIHGNMKKVSALTGISYNTLKEWKSTEWWQLAMREARDSQQDQFDIELTKAIHNAVNEIADRVKDGDWVKDKDGTKSRMPMKGRDIAITLGVLYDKRALVRGDAPSQLAHSSHSDKLQNLEKKFKEFARVMDEKTIEGEVLNASE
jgi:hypothetical protein